MFTLTIINAKEQIIKTYKEPVLLSDALIDAGLKFRHPCGGAGICGKCKVMVTGELSPISATEKASLSDAEISKGYRLACLCYALGDATLYYTMPDEKLQGVTSGVMPKFIKNPLVSSGYGCAVDIGTTTIAAYFYRLDDCTQISSVCVANAQAKYGSDVISRIDASKDNDKLTLCVKNQLKEIIDGFSHSPDICVITGNTTMLHFLCGLDASSIAVAPFVPKDLFGKWEKNVYLPPCISSYIGADITCAILSTSLTENDKSLLVDVGTNGEMAIFVNNKLVCCSTAAGPAFEGVGIQMGMVAELGAISRVYIKDDKLLYETVDNARPTGICGTGLIDAIACMLMLGIIDETGYLEDDYYIADSGVCITPSDVRCLQLAKSAVCAGIDTLLNHCGISPDEVSHFYIAGGFGQYLNPESCETIGLFPKKLADIALPVGNAAGSGACAILQSKQMLDKAEDIAKCAEAVELSESPYFMDRYVENMMFKGAEV